MSPTKRSDSGNYYCTYYVHSRTVTVLYVGLILTFLMYSYLRNEADVIEVRQQVDTLQDKFAAELHAEQQKNNLLQDKLDKISQEYESEVLTVRQQAEGLQRELEKEVKAHADTVSEDLQVITNLRAEQDDLRHRMSEEINNLQQNTLEKEERYERQLEELKTQLAVQTSVNLELSTELKASKEAEAPKRRRASRSPSLQPQPPKFWTRLKSQRRLTRAHQRSLPGKESVTLWD